MQRTIADDQKEPLNADQAGQALEIGQDAIGLNQQIAPNALAPGQARQRYQRIVLLDSQATPDLTQVAQARQALQTGVTDYQYIPSDALELF